MYQYAEQLLDLIEKSPSRYHATANLKNRLTAEGYTALAEDAAWDVRPGGRYVVTRNDSSLLAFRVPEGGVTGFALAAAHSDSPTFQIKEHAEKLSARCTVLDTEKYGGMLMNTWFDRPLSVAGRIIVERDGKLEARLVDVDRDLMIIPSVAIHMNRAANDGVKLLANVDTFPLLGCGAQDLRAIVAEAAGVAPEQILGHDLFLYLRGRGSVLGAEGELIGSPKLDDLACAFALTEGFLQSSPSGAIPGGI